MPRAAEVPRHLRNRWPPQPMTSSRPMPWPQRMKPIASPQALRLRQATAPLQRTGFAPSHRVPTRGGIDAVHGTAAALGIAATHGIAGRSGFDHRTKGAAALLPLAQRWAEMASMRRRLPWRRDRRKETRTVVVGFAAKACCRVRPPGANHNCGSMCPPRASLLSGASLAPTTVPCVAPCVNCHMFACGRDGPVPKACFRICRPPGDKSLSRICNKANVRHVSNGWSALHSWICVAIFGASALLPWVSRPRFWG